ncbi:MAG: autotransporter domain-containing protein [Elusimicrobiota bacterium]|nr:autotransporter domain-containing protein [Elusimicrobiota bacterium]
MKNNKIQYLKHILKITSIILPLIFTSIKSYGIDEYHITAWAGTSGFLYWYTDGTLTSDPIILYLDNDLTVGRTEGIGRPARSNTTIQSNNTSIKLINGLYSAVKRPGFSFVNQTGNFSNITFQNFSSATQGGVFYANNNAVLNFYGDIKFIGNTASIGAVIYAAGGANINFGTISNPLHYLEFSDNRSTNAGANLGIISMSGGNVSFNVNTVYVNNNSSSGTAGAGYGGAWLSMTDGVSRTFNIASMTVTNNRLLSENPGGAIFLNGAGTNLTINGTYANFTVNITSVSNSNTSGGAIAVSNNAVLNMNVSTVVFDGNKSGRDAPHMDVKSGGKIYFTNISELIMKNGIAWDNTGPSHGGGVYVGHGNSELSFVLQPNGKLTFENNTARTMGGAVNLYSGVAGVTSRLSFANGTITFKNNYAAGQGRDYPNNGGGVLGIENGGAGTAIISFANNYIDMTSNTANAIGGAILIAGQANSQLIFTDSIITAQYNKASSGSIIYMGGGTLDITRGGINFIGNISSAPNSQGNIALAGAAKMTLSNVNFMRGVGNKAASGGFLYIPSLRFDFTGDSLEMTGNTAFGNAASGYGKGGAFYFDGSTVTFSGQDMKFIGNVASSGAVLFAYNKASITFTGTNANLLFEANVSTLGKGVIAWFNGSTVSFKGLNSLNAVRNTAKDGGGFLFIDGANYVLGSNQINISSNVTPSSGGAVYLLRSKLNFDSSFVEFSNNISSRIGGAIYLDNSTITFNAPTMIFRNNMAPAGSVLFANNGSSVVFTGGYFLFEHNISSNGRGAISWNNSNVQFMGLDRLDAIDNVSSTGGFLYITNSLYNIEADEIYIQGNTADKGQGGGIYLSGSTMVFSNVHIDRNVALSSGGGVYLVNGSSITFKDTPLLEFSGNISSGGAGGAFFIDGQSYLGFENVRRLNAVGNKAVEGGFAYFINKKYTIDSKMAMSLIENTATKGSGGALYLVGSTFVFNGERPVFRRNVAYSSGGAAYLEKGALIQFYNFELLEFVGQTAMTGGGGVFFVDPVSSITFDNVGWIYAAENEAKDGGFLYIDRRVFDFATDAFETRVDLISNTANRGSGGALYLSSSSMKFAKAQLNANYNFAYSSGGVFFADYASRIDISSYALLSFTRNTTIKGGGGAFYAAHRSTISFNNVNDLTFAFNTGGAGGAIYAFASYINYRGALSGNKITFESNGTYEGPGGAIYADASTINVRVDSMLFYNNKAKGDGTLTLMNNSYFKTGYEGVKELVALNNKAQRGGFIYLYNMNQVFDADFTAIGNEAVGDTTTWTGKGGAIYIENSTIVVSGRNATRSLEFRNNFANPVYGLQGAGGAVYAKNSSVSFQTDGYDIIFDGNREGGFNWNDIHLDGEVFLTLHSYVNEQIVLNSGFRGTMDDYTLKTGYGMLIFGGYVLYNGILEIKFGTAAVSTVVDNKLSISTMTIGDAGKYGTLWKSPIHQTIVNKADIRGTLQTGLNLYKDNGIIAADLFSAAGGVIDLDYDYSSLEFFTQVFVPISQEKTVVIMQASTITGNFANYIDGQIHTTEKSNPFWTQYTVRYKGSPGGSQYVELGIISKYRFAETLRGLNHNQSEVASLLDGIKEVGSMSSLLLPLSDVVLDETYSGAKDYPKTKILLNELSGGFLVNVLSVGANADNSSLYSKIRYEEAQNENISILQYIWAQGTLSGFDLKENNGHDGDFTGTIGGIQAGFPLWRGRNSIGVFLSYDNKSLKEGGNKASVDDIKLGGYIGYFLDDINIKGNISAGIQNIKTERYVNFYDFSTRANGDFNTYSFSFGVLGEYIMPVDKETDFKPYAQLQTGLVFNGDMEESGADAVNLKINAGTYAKMNANFGVMLEDSTGTFNWHLRGYFGFVLFGQRPEYKMSFAYMPNYEMEIWGTDIPSVYIGAGAWVERKIGQDFSIFASGDVNTGEGSWIYAASLGVSYRIGGNYNQIKTSEDIMRSEDYKNQVSFVNEEMFAGKKAQDMPYKTTDRNVVVGAETQIFVDDETLSLESGEPSELYNNDIRIEVEEQKFENKVRSGDQISREEKLAHERRLEYLKVQAQKEAQIQAQRQSEKEAADLAAAAAQAQYTRAAASSVSNKDRRALANRIKESDDDIVVVRDGINDIDIDDADMNLYEIPAEEAVIVSQPSASAASSKSKVKAARSAAQKESARAADTFDALQSIAAKDNLVEYEEKSFKSAICVFDKGSYALSNVKKLDIKEVATQIKKYNYTKVSVIINKGARAIDKVLSENRARVIYEELYKNGIDIRKLDYINEPSDSANGDKGVIIIDYITQ